MFGRVLMSCFAVYLVGAMLVTGCVPRSEGPNDIVGDRDLYNALATCRGQGRVLADYKVTQTGHGKDSSFTCVKDDGVTP